MTTDQLANKFNQQVELWLNDQVPNNFILDDVEFELVYDGNYRVLCEGVEVAWNDNDRDFKQVGTFLFSTPKNVVLGWEAA